MQPNLSLQSTQAILILDGDGRRILAKYWDMPEATTLKEQRALEKKLFEKTRKGGDILMLDHHIVLVRNNLDVWFYIIGSLMESELVLSTVLNIFFDTVATLLSHIDRRSVTDNLDTILLILDETFDEGILLESNVGAIADRCVRKQTDAGMDGIQFNEQSISQALQIARENVIRSLRA